MPINDSDLMKILMRAAAQMKRDPMRSDSGDAAAQMKRDPMRSDGGDSAAHGRLGDRGEGARPFGGPRHLPHRGLGHVLEQLGEGEAISQRELADRLGIRPQSVSEAICILEERGLIERSLSPEDRRITLISITEEGLALRGRLAEERRDRAARLFGALSEEEKEQLAELLGKVIGSAD